MRPVTASLSAQLLDRRIRIVDSGPSLCYRQQIQPHLGQLSPVPYSNFKSEMED